MAIKALHGQHNAHRYSQAARHAVLKGVGTLGQAALFTVIGGPVAMAISTLAVLVLSARSAEAQTAGGNPGATFSVDPQFPGTSVTGVGDEALLPSPRGYFSQNCSSVTVYREDSVNKVKSNDITFSPLIVGVDELVDGTGGSQKSPVPAITSAGEKAVVYAEDIGGANYDIFLKRGETITPLNGTLVAQSCDSPDMVAGQNGELGISYLCRRGGDTYASPCMGVVGSNDQWVQPPDCRFDGNEMTPFPTVTVKPNGGYVMAYAVQGSGFYTQEYAPDFSRTQTFYPDPSAEVLLVLPHSESDEALIAKTEDVATSTGVYTYTLRDGERNIIPDSRQTVSTAPINTYRPAAIVDPAGNTLIATADVQVKVHFAALDRFGRPLSVEVSPELESLSRVPGDLVLCADDPTSLTLVSSAVIQPADSTATGVNFHYAYAHPNAPVSVVPGDISNMELYSSGCQHTYTMDPPECATLVGNPPNQLHANPNFHGETCEIVSQACSEVDPNHVLRRTSVLTPTDGIGAMEAVGISAAGVIAIGIIAGLGFLVYRNGTIQRYYQRRAQNNADKREKANHEAFQQSPPPETQPVQYREVILPGGKIKRVPVDVVKNPVFQESDPALIATVKAPNERIKTADTMKVETAALQKGLFTTAAAPGSEAFTPTELDTVPGSTLPLPSMMTAFTEKV